jgi:hypothetical protein
MSSQPLRQVYAYYFGWHTPDSWKDGRLIDRPQTLYNSQDPATLDKHIDQAKQTGIDAFVMSWFGPKNNNMTHTVFNMLLDRAAAKGFYAGAAMDMVDGGYNATVDEVVQSMRYLLTDRANHPAYLKFQDKPIIYFWNQGRFTVEQWAQIRVQVDPNRSSVWVMEGVDLKYLSVFEGLYLFNVAWSGNFQATATQWGSKMRAAGGWFYTPTVMPGWDESRFPERTNPTPPKARLGGAFLSNSWKGAVGSGAGIVIIVSWNEFLENSYIEPSQMYGTQALDTLQPLIAEWKHPRPAVQQPAAQPVAKPVAQQPAPQPVIQQPASAAGTAARRTVTVVNTDTLRVRQGPGTNFAQIGSVKQGETFPVVSQSGDWYQIAFNGQPGWLYVGYLTVKNA